MRWLAIFILIFACTDTSLGQCTMANWWAKFDHAGEVTCDSPTQYLTGLFRNDNLVDNDGIFLIEEGQCCQAPAPNQNAASSLKVADWWAALDKNYNWALCPAGYFLRGFYRNHGSWLWSIEEGRCGKPTALPDEYEHCYDENVVHSFDKKGITKCIDGYYMTGIYRGHCDRLHCLDFFKCCSMFVDDGCRMANWWGSFDHKGEVACGSSKEYLTGLWRNDNWHDNDGIFLIEEGKCCTAPEPNKDIPSSCINVNWRGILVENDRWAICPAGYFLQGFSRGDGHWLSDFQEARCCQPQTLSTYYGDCYEEDIQQTFDRMGLSKCKDGYYLTGIYKGNCNKLNCIDRFMCCSMNQDLEDAKCLETPSA